MGRAPCVSLLSLRLGRSVLRVAFEPDLVRPHPLAHLARKNDLVVALGIIIRYLAALDVPPLQVKRARIFCSVGR